MNITTKVVTTKVHSATFAAEDLKAVALSAIRGNLGLADAAVLSSSAVMADDGSVSVEIVESVPVAPPAPASERAAPEPAAVDQAAASPAPTPGIVIPSL